MCGIVAHWGTDRAVPAILEGLNRLEYRGYDSAGVALWQNRETQLEKAKGRITNLEKILENQKESSNKDSFIDSATIGLGHTRWATHGKVTDFNAHPHQTKNWIVVHNGIIENATDLLRSQVDSSLTPQSETDSEVFVLLLESKTMQGQASLDAFISTFQEVEGHSAFVALYIPTGEIYAVRNGAPLVAGAKQSGTNLLVSSDPYALFGNVDELIFPEDKVIVVLGEQGLKFLELDQTETKRIVRETTNEEFTKSELDGFDHYMLKEIHEQPELIEKVFNYYKDHLVNDVEKFIPMAKCPRDITIVACGTAWHAGLLIANSIQSLCRIPCRVELASEFRYSNPILSQETCVMFISQSGETMDTLACADLCIERKIPTIGLVNVKGSTLYRRVDTHFLINAGPEISVASTKAFTNMVIVGQMIALGFAKRFSLGTHDLIEKFSNDLVSLKVTLNKILEDNQANQKIRKIAEELASKKGFMFTGRQKCFPIALEGALKLKEIAYVHAEGYAAGELKHGPLAIIDESMVNLAIVSDELALKTVSNSEEIRARKGLVVGVLPKNLEVNRSVFDHSIEIDIDPKNELFPLAANCVLQLFAYWMAKFKGFDIDKPRNLAKSVTVE